MKLTAFDFDKTLTDKDTLFGFYRQLDGTSRWFILKVSILRLTALLYKLRFITNDRLKSIGVWLFVRGKTRLEIESAGETYADKIELNAIYDRYYRPLPRGEKIILSASFEAYLQKKFPGDQVVGSSFVFLDDRVLRLGQNMYGLRKRRWIDAEGIRLDRLFTDSFSDQPLMERAQEVFLVSNGEVQKIKG